MKMLFSYFSKLFMIIAYIAIFPLCLAENIHELDDKIMIYSKNFMSETPKFTLQILNLFSHENKDSSLDFQIEQYNENMTDSKIMNIFSKIQKNTAISYELEMNIDESINRDDNLGFNCFSYVQYKLQIQNCTFKINLESNVLDILFINVTFLEKNISQNFIDYQLIKKTTIFPKIYASPDILNFTQCPFPLCYKNTLNKTDYLYFHLNYNTNLFSTISVSQIFLLIKENGKLKYFRDITSSTSYDPLTNLYEIIFDRIPPKFDLYLLYDVSVKGIDETQKILIMQKEIDPFMEPIFEQNPNYKYLILTIIIYLSMLLISLVILLIRCLIVNIIKKKINK